MLRHKLDEPALTEAGKKMFQPLADILKNLPQPEPEPDTLATRFNRWLLCCAYGAAYSWGLIWFNIRRGWKEGWDDAKEEVRVRPTSY